MNIETRTFDNFTGKKTRDKFSPENEELFKENMPNILRSWASYLRDYVENTAAIFNTPEFPWIKFDETTWVSSLAIAIAKNYPDAILVEELPVKKPSSCEENSTKVRKKPTDLGNADMWCCINPPISVKYSKSRFSFYLEAKFSPGSRRKLAEHQRNPKIENLKRIKLEDVHNQIANSENKNNLLSRGFRDYQKSAGKLGAPKNYTTTSPHFNEKGRNHTHVFLTLLIKPILWETEKDEPWPEKVDFSNLFENKLRVHIKHGDNEIKKPTVRNFYNLPSTGIIMRDKDGCGFIALVLLLGEAKHINGEN